MHLGGNHRWVVKVYNLDAFQRNVRLTFQNISTHISSNISSNIALIST